MKRILMVTTAALLTAGCNYSEPQRSSENDQRYDQRYERRAEVVGPWGTDGPTGDGSVQGRIGENDRWTSYREFWFDNDDADIRDNDSKHITEIATYMRNNPSVQLGIDGSTNPRSMDEHDRNLSDRRVRSVRDSLIQAGVPSDRISDGMFGDVNLRRDRRVEVFIKTPQLSNAR